MARGQGTACFQTFSRPGEAACWLAGCNTHSRRQASRDRGRHNTGNHHSQGWHPKCLPPTCRSGARRLAAARGICRRKGSTQPGPALLVSCLLLLCDEAVEGGQLHLDHADRKALRAVVVQSVEDVFTRRGHVAVGSVVDRPALACERRPLAVRALPAGVEGRRDSCTVCALVLRQWVAATSAVDNMRTRQAGAAPPGAGTAHVPPLCNGLVFSHQGKSQSQHHSAPAVKSTRCQRSFSGAARLYKSLVLLLSPNACCRP